MGLGSFDEMGSMTLLVAAPSAAERNALRRAQNQHFMSQFTARLLGRPSDQPLR